MDITALYLTASLIPESFAKYQRETLLKAMKGGPVISISREPLKFGDKQIIDDKPKSLSNIYWQMLQAAKLVETEFVATAEDDVLYGLDHFWFFRPKPDTFCYDQHRWAIFTWGKPTYSIRQRKSNSTLIAPTKLLIETLEERFAKWPNGTPDDRTGEVGRRMVEKNLRVTERKCVEVYSEYGNIHFNHPNASEERQNIQRKKFGQIKAYSIPYWGAASTVVKLWK